VFAFPGNVEREGSQVTNLLIKNGAKLCTGADDIVREFEWKCGTALNPFKLPVKRNVNMNQVLTEYRVSALTPSDPVLRPAYHGPSTRKADKPTGVETPVSAPKPVPANLETTTAASAMPAFDRDSIRIYQKIPLDQECTIESLTDENTSLREVMKVLLKLEMASFVVMLPGEKVKRKLR
jgi:predicted Rossmann fold nucleotide-binding protein DprA/Smf involved in DNA uptake